MYKFFLIPLLLLCSCHNSEQEVLNDLNSIKLLGDDNPALALQQLDSLSPSIIYEPLHSRMAFQLLRIRLQDKAYVVPSSDQQIKEILPYFLENGSIREKQEVLFYAGSVYRDLNDTPRAIDYYLKSKDTAEGASTGCDSIMLRNTYSNLCYLFGQEHDNKSTLEYAREEHEISLAINRYVAHSILHLGEAFFSCDSINSALYYFDQLLQTPEDLKGLGSDTLARLLFVYSHLRIYDKADQCFDLLCSLGDNQFIDTRELFALGEYYRVNSKDKEAIRCFLQILEVTEDLPTKYDATRYLYLSYRNRGDYHKAIEYGDMFLDVCGELNLGKRQELAATVNNIYKYQRDKEAEQKLIIDKQAYQARYQRIVLLGIILTIIVITVAIYYRYCQLRKILRLKGRIENIEQEKRKIAKESAEKQVELTQTKEELNRVTEGLAKTRETLIESSEEVERLTNELRANECILREKIDQNKTIVSLMHQAELSSNAEDIILALKKSGDGIKQLSEKEWNTLYSAADRLWPTFKEYMCMRLGKVTDQQRQVCYLMRAGFTPAQIQNMTGLSRTTVWRWTKKYEWIYSII